MLKGLINCLNDCQRHGLKQQKAKSRKAKKAEIQKVKKAENLKSKNPQKKIYTYRSNTKKHHPSL